MPSASITWNFPCSDHVFSSLKAKDTKWYPKTIANVQTCWISAANDLFHLLGYSTLQKREISPCRCEKNRSAMSITCFFTSPERWTIQLLCDKESPRVPRTFWENLKICPKTHARMKFQFLFCAFFYACIQTMHFQWIPSSHHPKTLQRFKNRRLENLPSPLSQGLKPSPLAVRAWLKGGLMWPFFGGPETKSSLSKRMVFLFTRNSHLVLQEFLPIETR